MSQSCTQFEFGYLRGNSYSKALGSGKMGLIPLPPTLEFPPPSTARAPWNKTVYFGGMSGGVRSYV